MCYERSSGRLFGGKLTQFLSFVIICFNDRSSVCSLKCLLVITDYLSFLDCFLVVKVSTTNIINVYIPVLMMNQVIAVQGRRPALWLWCDSTYLLNTSRGLLCCRAYCRRATKSCWCNVYHPELSTLFPSYVYIYFRLSVEYIILCNRY